MTYRGHIQNGTVVLDDPVRLPEGAQVWVESVSASGDEVLAAARHVYEGLAADEVDKIERIALDRGRFF